MRAVPRSAVEATHSHPAAMLGVAALACLPILAGCHRAAPVTPAAGATTRLANVGFSQPENLVYDSLADLYYVSNMGPGKPDTHDDNGFISQVTPDGRVLRLRWIAGGQNGVVLDAPKGLAICADTLVVADVGAVHLFNRVTGKWLRSINLPGTMMNDVACGRDGALWVTDTGPTRGPGMDTTKDMDAVWRVGPDRRITAEARGLALEGPDGIVLDSTGALVSTFDGDHVEHVAMRTAAPARPLTAARGPRPAFAGAPDSAHVVTTLPGGKDDGLRRLADGSLVVTSWDAKAVYRLGPNGERTPLLTGVTSPAGVAIDTRRHHLAITSMQTNTLYLLPLP